MKTFAKLEAIAKKNAKAAEKRNEAAKAEAQMDKSVAFKQKCDEAVAEMREKKGN